VPRNGLQQVPEYPFIDLPDHARRKIKEANAALAGRGGPHNFSAGLYAHSGKTQFETQTNYLLWPQGGDRLNGNALMVEITNDSAIGLIEHDVGQGVEIMPMVASRLSRQ
jgi:hypothetical protein